MNAIGLMVFPLLLIGDAIIWMYELPYNLITTLDRLNRVFMEKYFLVLKKWKIKYKLNFVKLHGKLVRSSWDSFIGFMRSMCYHHMDTSH